jgi:hypothetical protein
VRKGCCTTREAVKNRFLHLTERAPTLLKIRDNIGHLCAKSQDVDGRERRTYYEHADLFRTVEVISAQEME